MAYSTYIKADRSEKKTSIQLDCRLQVKRVAVCYTGSNPMYYKKNKTCYCYNQSLCLKALSGIRRLLKRLAMTVIQLMVRRLHQSIHTFHFGSTVFFFKKVCRNMMKNIQTPRCLQTKGWQLTNF